MVTKICFFLFLCSFSQAKDVKLSSYKINLDLPPEERWNEVAKDYADGIVTVINLFKQIFTPRVVEMISILAADLVKYTPQPYSGEMVCFAEQVNLSIGEVMFLNMVYELTAYGHQNIRACTSIVAALSDGKILHGRNLDYNLGDPLRQLTIMVDFQKGGKTVYKGTTFAGYVGLLTGMKPNKFTVSLDQRNKGDWQNNAFQAYQSGTSGIIAFVIRDVLESNADFSEAVSALSSTHSIAPCYIIVGGLKDDEGAVITRNQTTAIDVWRLDITNDRWFLVETNYDHWNPPPNSDNRRDPANNMMREIGRSKLDAASMFQILSTAPVLNFGTMYTTIMSASDPDEYNAWIRSP